MLVNWASMGGRQHCTATHKHGGAKDASTSHQSRVRTNGGQGGGSSRAGVVKALIVNGTAQAAAGGARLAVEDVGSTAGVKTVILPPGTFDGFAEGIEEYAKASEVPLQPTTQDLPGMHRYHTAAAAYVQRFLPTSLLHDLQTFFVDPDAPSAIFIRGLPVQKDLPPTPYLADAFANPDAYRLPALEMLVTGFGRILGDLYFLSVYPTDSMFYYLVPDPSAPTSGDEDLLMHSDYPLTSPPLDGILLYGIKEEPSGTANTLVCDNRYLVSQMSPEDIKLLREKELVADVNGKPLTADSKWYAIGGEEHNPEVKLTIHFKSLGTQAWSDNQDVVDAHNRCMDLAYKLAERAYIGQGDLLILNNRRLTHGRTAFPTPPEGQGRWLGKAVVRKPGQLYTVDGWKWPRVRVNEPQQ